MADSVEDLPEVMIDVVGGDADEMVAGYLGQMAVFMALIVGIYAILAVQGLRTEETSGRADPVLVLRRPLGLARHEPGGNGRRGRAAGRARPGHGDRSGARPGAAALVWAHPAAAVLLQWAAVSDRS